MEENSKLAVLEALMTVQAEATRRIENIVTNIQQSNEAWRQTHEKATQEKLDHARRGTDAKFASVEGLLERKTDKSQSEERFELIKKSIDGKADAKDVSFLQKIVFGFCALVLVSVVGAVIALVVIKPEVRHVQQPTPVVQNVNR